MRVPTAGDFALGVRFTCIRAVGESGYPVGAGISTIPPM